MPKKNNNINNNTNKDNRRENIKHDRISKQSKKQTTNYDNAKSSKINKNKYKNKEKDRTNSYTDKHALHQTTVNDTNNTEVMRIDHIEVTDEVLADRSGILLFTRYLSKINIYPLINKCCVCPSFCMNHLRKMYWILHPLPYPLMYSEEGSLTLQHA